MNEPTKLNYADPLRKLPPTPSDRRWGTAGMFIYGLLALPIGFIEVFLVMSWYGNNRPPPELLTAISTLLAVCIWRAWASYRQAGGR